MRQRIGALPHAVAGPVAAIVFERPPLRLVSLASRLLGFVCKAFDIVRLPGNGISRLTCRRRIAGHGDVIGLIGNKHRHGNVT